MTTSSDNPYGFFQRIRNQKGQPAFDRRRIRFLGLALGVLAGLVYNLVAHSVNARYLPGVPWIEYPLGFWGNLGLLLIFGAVAGWLCAAAQDMIEGVAKGSLVLTILFELYVFLTPYNSVRERLVLMLWGLALLVVFTSLMVFYLAYLRWAVDRQIEFSEQPAWHWKRSFPLVGFIAMAAIMGFFTLAPGGQLQALRATHTLLQAGLAAPDASGLPEALQPKRSPYHHVRDFLNFAEPEYTVEILRDARLRQDLNAWAESPASVVVLARFENNWVITCQYDQPLNRVLACQDYAPGTVPQPGISQLDQFLISLR